MSSDPQLPLFADQSIQELLAPPTDTSAQEGSGLTAEQHRLLRRTLYSRVNFDPELCAQFWRRVPKEHRKLRSTAAQARYYDGSFEFQDEIDQALQELVRDGQPDQPIRLQDFVTDTLMQELLDRQTRWGMVGESWARLQEFYHDLFQALPFATVLELHATIRARLSEHNRRTADHLLAAGDVNTGFALMRGLSEAIKQHSPHVERYAAPAAGEQQVYISSETQKALQGRRHGGFTPGSSGGGRGR